MIDAQYLNRCARKPVDDDVRQTGNNQLAGTWNSPNPASRQHITEEIDSIEEGPCDRGCRVRALLLDIFGNMFNILSSRFGPSNLYWIQHLWSLGFQCPLDSFPNLRWREQLAAIGGIDSFLDRRVESRLFGKIPVHSFTS